MELYDQKINEFVDWVSGNNKLTGRNVTENMKPSGKVIRELLQDRLQSPIFIPSKDNYEGYVEDGYWRIFSSKEAYSEWLKDKNGLARLELARFPKQSEYEFEINGLDNNLRYIIEGNASQSNAILNYSWAIKKGNNNVNDSIRVTYTITNRATKKTTTFTHLFQNSQRDIELNIYEYLESGENNISINFQGIGTSATAGAYLTIKMIQFDIEADWDYTSQHRQGSDLIIDSYKVNRNDNDAEVTVCITVDGKPVYDQLYQKRNSNIQATNVIITNKNEWHSSVEGTPIEHNMQMWAQTSYNNTIFTSNILYWNFEIAATESIPNHFINLFTSIDSEGLSAIPVNEVRINAKQYISTSIEYGYYTDHTSLESSIQVLWKIVRESSEEEQILGTYTANKGVTSTIEFIPLLATESRKQLYLVAIYDDKELKRIPLYVEPGEGFIEQGGYSLKLSAYGHVNDSSIEQKWSYGSGSSAINTTFVGINWDDNKGWHRNSFRTFGVDSYAEINYAPLQDNSNGKTIEIDFESEKINSTNDIIVLIGNKTGARIEITPNCARFYDAANVNIIETNFKANERLHLAFIINKSETNSEDNKSNLVYIVNNGILERAVSGLGHNFSSNGTIKIGNSRSGVRVYGLRVYDYDITYTDAYNNYVFDSDDKVSIKTKNKVIDTATNKIDYELCCNKIDTILIKGDLSQLLKSTTNKDQSKTDVEISRICPYDKSKDFTCTNAMIRKHGQSTLNYPVPSMKFWLNKSKSGVTPTFVCTAQEELGLNKNRYKMKDTSIPSNKFVLQANYADSSGVHNGALQRLINSSWWGAKIDNEFKLRTLPQLFSSNQTVTHNNANLNEDKDSNKELITGKNKDDKLWKDYAGDKKFPHQIQVGPDSFPCVVFYSDTSSGGETTFLGLYVFMEDKKADFIFGERSIYYYKDTQRNFDIADDPFVLKYINTKKGEHAIELPNGNTQALDSAENRIWDNANVLRIEGLTINTKFSSFMSFDDNGTQFDEPIVPVDEQGNPTGERIYRWEQDFELIYPDPDDIVGKYDELTGKDTTKFGLDSKFRKKTQPWVEFVRWITGMYDPASKTINHEKFQHEAAQHLDLYKMAAYYVIFLRFGLVDSVERNAQWKTYDGIHWHCEPWDMDIALGNMNSGGIAFDPPIDRNSTFKTDAYTYAYSGKSQTTSNVLWDSLEHWKYWADTIVPTVAQALYEAGLTYKNISKMFDDEYQNKWCEILYNESMSFKYIKSRGTATGWLSWLQGARTTHRHWWLSTSMNYWDSKWNCGDYKNHKITVFANKDMRTDGAREYIVIRTNGSTYLNITRQDQTIEGGLQYATISKPAYFDITEITMSNKVEFQIYGATFIEEFDGSAFASGLSSIKFDGAYDETLGAPIKKINLGCPYETNSTGEEVGTFNGILTAITLSDEKGNNAAQGLQEFNVNGQINYKSQDLINEVWEGNKTELQNFYGRGSGITSFYSSKSGNNFINIELPGHTYSNDGTIGGMNPDGTTGYQFNELNLTNSTWENITWYDGEIDMTSSRTFEDGTEKQEGTITYRKTGIGNDENASKYNIPWSLNKVVFKGSTAKTDNSKKFVIKWIDCIRKYLEYQIEIGNIVLGEGKYSDYPTFEPLLYSELNKRELQMDGIKWDADTCEDLLTYDQLALIAQFNYCKNNPDHEGNAAMFKGYIELSAEEGELSVEQLTQLKEWFGEQIFSLKSSGLVIDQKLPYIKINVGNVQVEKDPITNELKICLEEGNDATLSATRFQLQEQDAVTTWGIKEPGSLANAGMTYKGCTLYTGKDGIVRLRAVETQYGNRDVEIVCSMQGETESSSVIIHIKAVVYPESITLGVDQSRNKGAAKLRSFKGAYVFWQNGLFGEFYPDIAWKDNSNGEKPVTISDVRYVLLNSAGDTLMEKSYTAFNKDQNSTGELNDEYMTYTLDAQCDYGCCLTTSSVPSKGYNEYILKISIRYASNQVHIVEMVPGSGYTTKIIVIDDRDDIVNTNSTLLYNALKDHYFECNNEAYNAGAFHKTELLSLTGTISFRDFRAITDLTTLTDKSIFEYLPNIEGIDISGCTQLNTSVGGTTSDAKKNFVFNQCLKLKTFNANGCTQLGKGQTLEKFTTLDFGANTAMEKIFLEKTLVNISVSNSSHLNELKLGYPTKVSLANQNDLYSGSVSVSGCKNITEIVLTTDSQTKTDLFNTFANIVRYEDYYAL